MAETRVQHRSCCVVETEILEGGKINLMRVFAGAGGAGDERGAWGNWDAQGYQLACCQRKATPQSIRQFSGPNTRIIFAHNQEAE